MSVILEFGKYKGKALEEFQDGDTSYIMKWGRFKNKSVKWIFDHEKQYFNWMCKNEYIKNKCPSLKENLDEFNTQS
ncbi:Hypothetical protein PHPALM_17626 [Phytophthora palmivora]|uniref:Uncharacterized protein n=1 Tax=Phytophthora palmivora TaxID=4796 RepID=A0A2P4XLU2_9STRA|nr:Hypothetical protein PHPALM_17626 [Phytophthora palmivora]